MSSLLTHEEYQAIAGQLELPGCAYIDGKFRSAHNGDTFESINPANGQVLASITACGQEEVDFAVSKARQAFEDGRWSGLPPVERKQVMIRLCKLIARNARELAVMESLESGKPISEIETIDIPETIHCMQWHAEAMDKIYGQVAPGPDDVVAMIVREPVGVVACVLPWNFPLMMIAWKMAPALGAGNSLIIKPAEETSMTALRLAELVTEAGVPDGVVNVTPGPGELTGRAVGLHPDVDMVSFTGSTEVGKLFLRYSANSNMKRVVLECGGKNPCIVLDDAEDLDAVARHVTNGAFWNMGENCSASSRLIVHEAVADALVERVLNWLRNWRTGPPLDPASRLGAIVSEKQHRQILDHVKSAGQQGATVLAGGKAMDIGSGFFIEPTVLADVTPDMAVAREEIFGPVLAVIAVGDESQALRIANDTCYGLTASLFTASLRRAHRMSRAIRAGTVTVNCFGEGNITTPFGGYKQSGFGGRDNSLHAHDQYTELKTIWIDVSDQDTGEDPV